MKDTLRVAFPPNQKGIEDAQRLALSHAFNVVRAHGSRSQAVLDVAMPTARLHDSLLAQPVHLRTSIPNALADIGPNNTRILA